MSLPGASGRQPEALSPALAALLIVLAMLTVLYFAWPAWRAFLPLQIVYSDGWNTFHADRLLQGRPLYPDADALIANNYPPLSFLLVAALAAASGIDPLLIGRWLSLGGTVASAGAIAVAIRQLGGTRAGALVGALAFAATASRFYALFVGVNDPHLMALAIMLWALVWFFRLERQGRPLAPAILMMVIAGFTKHTLLAVPAAALIHAGLADWRRGLRAALFGIVAAALGLVACALLFGEALLQNLLMPRTYAPIRVLSGAGRLQWIAPMLMLTAIWLWYQRRGLAARFVGLFVGLAFVSQAVQLTGAGVVDNVHFELMAAAAIGTGLAFSGAAAIPAAQRLGVGRVQAAMLLILIARLFLTTRLAPYLLVASPDFHALLRDRVAIARSEAARIAAIPGPVSCTVMLVCRSAGKPFVFDAFAVSQRIETGHTTQEAVDRQVQAQGIRFEPVDPRADLDTARLP